MQSCAETLTFAGGTLTYSCGCHLVPTGTEEPHPVACAPHMPTWAESGQNAGGTTTGVRPQCYVPSPTAWKHSNHPAHKQIHG